MGGEVELQADTPDGRTIRGNIGFKTTGSISIRHIITCLVA